MDGLNRQSRSYTLVRTLILGSASLAIVGVLFAVYRSVIGEPPVRSATVEERLSDSTPPDDETGHPDDGDSSGGDDEPENADNTILTNEGIGVSGGERVEIRLYAPDSDRARLELSVQSWEPEPGSKDRFRLVDPEIRLRTPNGQLVNVTADSGSVILKESVDQQYDIRRGILSGNVRIKADRLTDEQRQALPPQERNEPGPDRLIEIKLDDLEFDLEYARVSTPGVFQINAAEVDVAGTGFALLYNDRDSSIKQFEITKNGEIVARGFGEMVSVSMPGPEQTTIVEPEPAAEESPPVAEAPPPDVADQADIPVVTLKKADTPRVHETVFYRANFSESVAVRQVRGQELAAQLKADVLEVLFGFGQQQRDTAKQRSAESPDQPGDGTEGAPADSTDELRIVWSGPLLISAIDPAAEPDLDLDLSDVHVTATGQPVWLAEAGNGELECGRLEYHQGSRKVWLYQQGDQPVTIGSARGGRLEGREVFLDMQTGVAKVTGPGRLSGRSDQIASTPGSTSEWGKPDAQIRFKDHVDVLFGQRVETWTDPQTGVVAEKRRQFLQSADFYGDAELHQGSDMLAGQHIKAQFDPPIEGGEFVGNINRLDGDGGVRLARGGDTLECERLEADLAADESGGVAPRRVKAYGDVVVAQGQQTISAEDRMFVEMRSFRVEREPWNLRLARAEAIRRGIDPQAVDWEAQRDKYESTDRFRPGLLTMQAFGHVRVRDPNQGVVVDSETLDCSFVNGRDIDKALVVGTEKTPAHVEFDDFSVTGRELHIDMMNESASVPGAGRMTFASEVDLDGRKLDQPMPMAISWAKSMDFLGEKNRAIFRGAVHAATKESVFDCRELTVDFVNKPQPAGAAAAKRSKKDVWLFGKLYKLIRGQDTEESGGLARDFNREPIYVIADGDAVALTSKIDPVSSRLISRGRISGPLINVDLRAEVVSVVGSGNLLMEDYELPTNRSSSSEARTPFGAEGTASPSQTFLRWSGQMTYYYGNQAAIFEQGVEMHHVSGGHILLRDGFAGDVAYRQALAKLPTGRDAQLTCDSMVAGFSKASGGGGAGRMSGYDLSRFEANQQVLFEDTNYRVIAQQITYDSTTGELTIRGSRAGPAEFYDRRSSNAFSSGKGALLIYNTTTGQIEIPTGGTFISR